VAYRLGEHGANIKPKFGYDLDFGDAGGHFGGEEFGDDSVDAEAGAAL
jgi:hypothetical protein